ncbi:hypothetical protein HZ326_6894 [Fusarium oxysporum f. sp. albedinis]|nr:hypothetical protein HZ326_6894 [Fusarium oxysporum f. sp. albedinis]
MGPKTTRSSPRNGARRHPFSPWAEEPGRDSTKAGYMSAHEILHAHKCIVQQRQNSSSQLPNLTRAHSFTTFVRRLRRWRIHYIRDTRQSIVVIYFPTYLLINYWATPVGSAPDDGLPCPALSPALPLFVPALFCLLAAAARCHGVTVSPVVVRPPQCAFVRSSLQSVFKDPDSSSYWSQPKL